MDDLQRDELVVLVLNGTAEIQAGISATQREANSLQLKKFVPCFLKKNNSEKVSYENCCFNYNCQVEKVIPISTVEAVIFIHS